MKNIFLIGISIAILSSVVAQNNIAPAPSVSSNTNYATTNTDGTGAVVSGEVINDYRQMMLGNVPLGGLINLTDAEIGNIQFYINDTLSLVRDASENSSKLTNNNGLIIEPKSIEEIIFPANTAGRVVRVIRDRSLNATYPVILVVNFDAHNNRTLMFGARNSRSDDVFHLIGWISNSGEFTVQSGDLIYTVDRGERKSRIELLALVATPSSDTLQPPNPPQPFGYQQYYGYPSNPSATTNNNSQQQPYPYPQQNQYNQQQQSYPQQNQYNNTPNTTQSTPNIVSGNTGYPEPNNYSYTQQYSQMAPPPSSMPLPRTDFGVPRPSNQYNR